LIAVAVLTVGWKRRFAATVTHQGASQSGDATPLLTLECAELGIGGGQAPMGLILDSSGVIRPPSEIAAAGLPPFRFAPIKGIVISKPGPGPVFALAAEVAWRWRPDWEERLGPVTVITARGECGLAVETADGVTVEFLAEELDRQFRNLTWIWRHSQKEGREIATVNLMPKRNGPVTFR
jgi:hypothetical protein